MCIRDRIPVAEKGGRGADTPGTAEDGGDLFQQHRHGEGLGHIVVDLQVKAPKLLRLPVQGGEHEDGDLGFLADQLAHAEAVYFGQHDVQQDQVKGDVYKRQFNSSSEKDAVAVGLYQNPNRSPAERIRFEKEEQGGGRMTSFLPQA